MRGVADQRDALGNERTGDEEAERMHAPGADDLDRAEMQLEALLQFGMKGIVRQRHDALGLLRALGPYDRGAAALERQDGERPGREKMLLGAAAMVALMRDIGHDRRLAVIPAVRGDARRLADGRARAVGGDEEAGRRSHSPSAEFNIDVLRGDARISQPPLVAQLDAELARFGFQRSDQMPVLDHVGEWFARLDLSGEGEKDRPHRVVEPAVGHDHVEDRLRFAGDGLPRPRLSRTAGAPPRRWRKRVRRRRGLRPAPDRQQSTPNAAPALAATRSQASVRQSRRRRSARRFRCAS